MKQYTLFLSFFTTVLVSAQTPQFAVVRPDGTTYICPSFDSAYNKAGNGDNIFLPAGGFAISNPIQKRIHIFGAGHNPDSTIATGRTIITGGLTIDTGANNGSITGCYLTGSTFYEYGQIYFNSAVNGYTISRCYISGGISSNSLVTNVLIKENFIGAYSICYTCSNPYSINFTHLSSTVSILNSIIASKVQACNSLLANNIFLFTPSFSNTLTAYNCTIQNNIFQTPSHQGSGSTYNNNINGGINGVDGNGNQGSNNISAGIALNALFVNYQGFNYTSDFHLVSGSPYATAGTDGTPIGIYGGGIPWQDGSVPSNPHIYLKQVAPQTNNNGQLPVQFKVRTNN